MAKAKGRARKRAVAAGRNKPRARKSGAPKAPGTASRRAKLAKSALRARKPSSASETLRVQEQLKIARLQQDATAEILRAVANAAGELQPVFKTVLENATRLCDARFGTVHRFEGNAFYFAADVGAPQALAEFMRRPGPVQAPLGGMLDRIKITRQMQHTPDYAADPIPGLGAKLGGARSTLGVPILRDDVLVGALVIYRQEVRPFSDREIDLVRSFAAQAAIAIENARLFNETKEALEQQTATGDVLKIISRSSVDLETVLDTLAETVTRLCRADNAAMYRRRDEMHYLVASYGLTAEMKEFFHAHPVSRDRGSLSGRVELERRAVHIVDTLQDAEYTFREGQKVGGYRTLLGIPLLRGSESIGHFNLARTRVEPFTNKEIELAATFADQAVIAIENARLFNEVQARTRDLEESLHQQTATANVLKVISRSAFDLQPVLKALVSSAVELAGAFSGAICIRDGETFRYRAGAGPGYSEKLQQYLESSPIFPGRGSTPARIMLSGKIEEIPDVLEDKEYKVPLATLGLAARSLIGVPLLGKHGVEGSLTLTRLEPGHFAPRIIELVQIFADQAVIAIENTRLFNETKEALERQTATADILKVIASSPSDVQPVFDAIASSARELIGGFSATVSRIAGDKLHLAAFTPTNASADKVLQASFPIPLAEFPPFETVRGGETMQFIDTEAEGVPITNREVARLRGYRSMLFTPLMKNGNAIGMISVTRKEPGVFLDHHVQLLQTFADQAVIAIENTRLFSETQEALERQTATADILKVIASSPSDVQPVFEAIATRANSLVGGFSATVFRFMDGMAHLMAFTPTTPEADEILKSTFPSPLDMFAPFQMAQNGEVAQVPDTEVLTNEILDISRARGFRSMVFAPLMNKGTSIGLIAVTRLQTGAFSEHHVQLLRTFADQAVIAIENVRLFDEVQSRTRELSKSLDDLRAAQDRLVQTEKLASLGQLTAGIAHEIKNPLNFVNNFSALSAELVGELGDALAPAPLDPKLRDDVGELTQMLKSNLEKVVQHGKRADSIVKNMLLHSREGSGEHRPADVNALVDESLNLAYHGARAEKPQFNVTLQRDFDPDAGMVEAFPQEITRVLLNLISNGFYAVNKRKTDNGGAGFEPLVTASTRGSSSYVEIRIRDNGTGIPPDVQEKMFNPFFTTKPAGEGTGLGLSMSHDIIVKQHGGTIQVETLAGEFTEFLIRLPRKRDLKNNVRG